MLTITEMIFGLIIIVIIVAAIFLLIGIIFSHPEREVSIRQIKEHNKTFKIEKDYPIRSYQYE